MKPLRISVFIAGTLGLLWLSYDAIQHIRAEYFHRYGYVQSYQGFNKTAAINFKQAVDLMPWENHYRLQLAKTYASLATSSPQNERKYTPLAIHEYQTLIESDDLNPWYKARLGLLYLELYKKNGLNESYVTLANDYGLDAAEDDPKNPLFSMNYAHLAYSLNDFKTAKLYYEKTLSLDNDLLEAHLNLGLILDREANTPEAILHYEFIVDQLRLLDKKYTKRPTPELKATIEKLQRARIRLSDYYLTTNQYDKAWVVIQDMPLSIEKYERLALYYEKTDQPNAAISIYEQLNKQTNNAYINQIKSINR